MRKSWSQALSRLHFEGKSSKTTVNRGIVSWIWLEKTQQQTENKDAPIGAV